jgi:hypothetical protein
MERGGNRQQSLAHQVKEKPQDHHTQQALAQPEDSREAAARSGAAPGQFLQAGRANDAIIVFRDAFAAEELPTLQAPRRRLALRVIETSLLGQVCSHSSFRAHDNGGSKGTM